LNVEQYTRKFQLKYESMDVKQVSWNKIGLCIKKERSLEGLGNTSFKYFFKNFKHFWNQGIRQERQRFKLYKQIYAVHPHQQNPSAVAHCSYHLQGLLTNHRQLQKYSYSNFCYYWHQPKNWLIHCQHDYP